jgi:hypothetical protein
MCNMVLCREMTDVLGTILMGPGEVLVLLIITAIVVFLAARRSRIRR